MNIFETLMRFCARCGRRIEPGRLLFGAATCASCATPEGVMRP